MLRVGVVGAGAAGLVAARLLTASPHSFAPPVVFEQSAAIGGTWVYTDDVGTDQHGLPIHASMYRNLKTNLPKEVMGYPDFPFQPESYSGKSFVYHDEVLDYLRSYAAKFDLARFIQFETRVENVTPSEVGDPQSGWHVTTRDLATNKSTQHHFDALIVCNGHYSVPLIPDLPGLDQFKGRVMHSHDYRVPDPFTGKRVALLGGRASGMDISLDVATVASQVYLAHNNAALVSTMPENMRQTVGVSRLEADGAVLLDGTRLDIDTLILCTGYEYVFPFLSAECEVSVEEQQVVQPLYKHVIHTRYPRIAFIGIPKTVLPFPLFHIQFFLASLSGRLRLPARADMEADATADLRARLERGWPRRYAHTMGSLQWPYLEELAAAAGASCLPAVTAALYEEVHQRRTEDLGGYKQHVYRVTGADSYVEMANGEQVAPSGQL